MRGPIVVLLVLLAAAACAAAAGVESCLLCRTAREFNGWCELHATGYVANVPIRSALLYETLDAHGHSLDLSTFTCPSCRRAIETDGFCEEHRIGFLHQQAFFSWLTWELARAEKLPAESLTCATCRRNAARHGWCDRCRLGLVGTAAIRDPEEWRRMARTIDLLEAAIRETARCEQCALAMVTDTECPVCRITWKEGKPFPRTVPPAAPPAP